MVMEAPTPICVGMEFVRQYYTILNKAPSLLHRFYAKNSSFMHGGDISNREPIIGQSDIHNYIKELNYKDCHAKILLIDSQATLGDGIVIQVTGELSNDGRPMRRFMQTFVLAPQSEKKYYVHNDIFRYQDQVFTSAASMDSSNDADDDVEAPQQQDNGYVEELQRQQEAGPTPASEGLAAPPPVAPSGVGVSGQPVLGEYAPAPVALHPQTAAPPTHPPGVHAVPTPQQPPVMAHPQQPQPPQQLNGNIVPQDISAASVVPQPQQQQAPAPAVPAPQQQAYSHIPAPVAHHQHPAAPQVAEVAPSVPSQQPPAQPELNDDDTEWSSSSNTASKWEDPVPPPRPQPQQQQQPAARVQPQPQQHQHQHHHQGRNTASVAPSQKVVEKKEDQAPLSYAAAANSMGGGLQQQQPLPSQYPSPPVAAVTPAPSAPSQAASSQQSQPREQQQSRQNSHSRDQQGPSLHPRDRDHNGGFQKSGRGSRQPYRMRQSNYSESGEHSGADDHTNSSESSYSGSRYENRRRDDQASVPDTQQIFVGNVPPNVLPDQLRETFIKFGKILDVRINPGKSKVGAGPTTNGKGPNSVPNIGFITFDDEESVRKVLNARPIKLDPNSNHRLNVEEKKNNRPRTNPRPPMGGRGSFNRMDGGRGPAGAGPRGGFSGPRRS